MMTKKKANRFIIEEGDVRVMGRHEPTEEERRKADKLFGRILSKKKPHSKSKQLFFQKSDRKRTEEFDPDDLILLYTLFFSSDQ